MKSLGALVFAMALVLGVAAEEGKYSSQPQPQQQPVDPRPVKQTEKGVDPAAATGDAADKSESTEAPEVAAGDFSAVLDFSILDTIAIQDNGRNKPLQTFITEKMELIVGRKLFKGVPVLTEKLSKQNISGNDLFLSLWLKPKSMIRVPLILVSYGPLKEELGLTKTDKHFSFERLRNLPKLQEIGNGAHKKRLAKQDKELTSLEKEAEIVLKRMTVAWSIINGAENLKLIPHPNQQTGDWVSLSELQESFGDLKQSVYNESKANVLYEKFNAFAIAYRERDPSKFSTSTQELRSELAALSPFYPPLNDLNREISYNKTRPFAFAWAMYLVATVLGLFALKYASTTLYRTMMAFYLGGLALHVYGFVLRCLIAGRPPVSNMYESVIWVGFGAVLFGLIFELIYRKRYFAMSGAASGFFCLVLMDTIPILLGNTELPGFGSDIAPLQPVLRDNFWLTVHVLTITLSYAAFKLGWVLGHVTLFSHLFRPTQKAEQHELHQFIYRATQVGVLLLAIGTILGGVWAYYSWGRFWGWDPKENWALISLISYLIVLHGRFAGWWGNFGLSFGSVFCFWNVVMAWYGVNFVLGSGMHAYGSGAGGGIYVVSVGLFDVVFLAAGTIAYWNAKKKASGVAKTEDEEDDDDDSKLSASDPIKDARANEMNQPAPSAGE